MVTTLLYSLFALDQTLAGLAAQHAWLLFAALFIVIFAETGLVVFPLLPGDSLLFLAGTVVAASGINVHLLVVTLFIAAVLGDSVNYGIGRYVGPKVFHRPQDSVLGRFLKPQYLERTRRYYEKYGGFTIVIGRFVPIVRTFAPFLAGIGAMTYRTFLSYNVLGAAVWVSLLVYAGYLFGNIPWVKDNLAYIVVAIVIISLIPMVVQWMRERRGRKSAR
jgi:membrane-associated protein